MAKEQKRGNREAKKPKAVKQPVAETSSAAMTRGTMAPLAGSKKKH